MISLGFLAGTSSHPAFVWPNAYVTLHYTLSLLVARANPHPVRTQHFFGIKKHLSSQFTTQAQLSKTTLSTRVWNMKH